MSRYINYDDDDDEEEETVQKKIYLSEDSDDSDLAGDESSTFGSQRMMSSDSESDIEIASQSSRAASQATREEKPLNPPVKKDRRPSRRDKILPPMFEEEPVDDVIRGLPTAQQQLKKVAVKDDEFPRFVCTVCGLPTATREKFEKHLLFHDDKFIVLQQHYEEKDQQELLTLSKKRYYAAGLDLFEKDDGNVAKLVLSELEQKPTVKMEVDEPKEVKPEVDVKPPKVKETLVDPAFGHPVHWKESISKLPVKEDPAQPSSSAASKDAPSTSQPQPKPIQLMHARPFQQRFANPQKEKPADGDHEDGSDTDSDASGDELSSPPYFHITKDGTVKQISAGEAFHLSMKQKQSTPDLPTAIGRSEFKPEVDPELYPFLNPEFRPLAGPNFLKPESINKVPKTSWKCAFCPANAPQFKRIRFMLEHMFFDHWVDFADLEVSCKTWSVKVIPADNCDIFDKRCPLKNLEPTEFVLHALLAHTHQLLGDFRTQVSLKMTLSTAGDDEVLHVKWEDGPKSLTSQLYDPASTLKHFRAKDRKHPRVQIAREKPKKEPPVFLKMPIIKPDGQKGIRFMVPQRIIRTPRPIPQEVPMLMTADGTPMPVRFVTQLPPGATVVRQVNPEASQIPSTSVPKQPQKLVIMTPDGKPVPGVKQGVDEQGRTFLHVPPGFRVIETRHGPPVPIQSPPQLKPMDPVDIPMPLSSATSKPQPPQPKELPPPPVRKATPHQPAPQRIPIIKPVLRGVRPNVVSIVRPSLRPTMPIGPRQIRIVPKTGPAGVRPSSTITRLPVATPLDSSASSTSQANNTSEEYIDIETVDDAPKAKQQPPKRMMALSNLVPTWPAQQQQQQPNAAAPRTVRPVRKVIGGQTMVVRAAQPGATAATGPRGPRPMTTTTTVVRDGKIVRIVRTKGPTVVQKPNQPGAKAAPSVAKPAASAAAKTKGKQPAILQKKATPIANKTLAAARKTATPPRKPAAAKPASAKATKKAVVQVHKPNTPTSTTKTFITTSGAAKSFKQPSEQDVLELMKSPKKPAQRKRSTATTVSTTTAAATTAPAAGTTNVATTSAASESKPAPKRAIGTKSKVPPPTDEAPTAVKKPRVVLPAKMPLSAAMPQRPIKRATKAPIITPITTASPGFVKSVSEDVQSVTSNVSEPQVDHSVLPEPEIDVVGIDDASMGIVAAEQQIASEPQTYTIAEYQIPTSSNVTVQPYVVESQIPGTSALESQPVDNMNAVPVESGQVLQQYPMFEFGDDADEELLQDFLEPPPASFASQSPFQFSNPVTEPSEQPPAQLQEPEGSIINEQQVEETASEQHVEEAAPEQHIEQAAPTDAAVDTDDEPIDIMH